ncbi:MAG: D-alanine--D-alanine ligase [Patescibacteria group bacterium]
MNKLNVAVLFGGQSQERAISVISGTEVVKNLNKKKYNVFPVKIEKDGIIWKYKNKRTSDYYALLHGLKIDIVFIAMHGPFGEDGTIQGLLELIGLKYTGSGILASSLAINKIYSKQLFTQVRLTVPKGFHLTKGQPIPKKLEYPLFVKPFNQGSSIGTSKVTNSKGLEKAFKNAFSYSDKILVEEFIAGVEVTCAILGNNSPMVLPLVEIVPRYEYFDFKSKYDPKRVQEICPARINDKLTKKVQQAAVAAYKVLGCRSLGRVDMIIKNNQVFVLEMQTIPGLTPLSLLPKAALAAGIDYPKLLDKIIEYSFNDK